MTRAGAAMLELSSPGWVKRRGRKAGESTHKATPETPDFEAHCAKLQVIGGDALFLFLCGVLLVPAQVRYGEGSCSIRASATSFFLTLFFLLCSSTRAR